jgi:ABC-type amino acid transport substrate-binding protein
MLIRSWIAASVVLLFAGWARADTLDEIKKRGEMVIGMEAAYVPYESIQDGKIIGFDCDIGQHFADKLGVKGSSSTPNGPASSPHCTRRNSIPSCPA